MRFEILVEDASGKIALESLVPKVLGPEGAPHTWRIFSYKGIGRIPDDLRGKPDPKKRILLANLPRILRGYGKSLQRGASVVVLVDCDTRDCIQFLRELAEVHGNCDPAPATIFRLAIEEIEAWYFGDPYARCNVYPGAKSPVLNSYRQDSQCGTWEKLADAIYPGGSKRLKEEGWPRIGVVKCEWASRIAPQMDIGGNASHSFRKFRDGLRRISQG